MPKFRSGEELAASLDKMSELYFPESISSTCAFQADEERLIERISAERSSMFDDEAIATLDNLLSECECEALRTVSGRFVLGFVADWD
jgi:hypothetical protein